MAGFFITGTDTDVGKTIVTGLISAALNKRGTNTIPYKPVQSGSFFRENQLYAPDVDTYEKMNNKAFPQSSTYLLEAPVSPHLAARWDTVTVKEDKIYTDYLHLSNACDCILVEGAGGVAVPIIDENYCVSDLMKDLKLPVIVVARAGLGTINHTTLTVHYIRQLGLPITGIIMNGFENSEKQAQQENVNMIEKMTNVPVIGQLPFVQKIEQFLDNEELILSLIEQINIEFLIKMWREQTNERSKQLG
ncbi:dethiobiotin synthase [Alkalihalobacterium chitinilyticum]|uniref:ATP-dependent dethiobiotin synthetase BioD n=1 Tax=Alkalihalobacterium chitinilyticum TaxID=2980103 RepID=A0ABT5VA95_9BACI|nr:dethiobiotin synthase [Alkalihalobacterium chitinilyticum]MDE5412036.1 dethiobiotin synthase [Alkalihalobacterium chitinilyticum]